MVALEDGSYKVVNPATNMVLAIEGDPQTPWANVNVQAWNNTDTQKWRVVHVGGGYYKLFNVASGKSLDVGGANIDSGANVGTWEDIPGGPAQMRSEEHTSELQSRENLVCRLLL